MRWKLMLGCCLAVMGFAACGSEDSDENQWRKGRLTLREGKSFDQAQACGVDLPQCPQGLGCIAFTLDGVSQARCVNESTVCSDLLSCTGGTECVVLDSYPGQVTCSGRCTSDCDSSVSVSNP
ncbi:hypothetical protein [Pyxidicoccus trucidator]|uniref:hypothetical protein n=1 Tax=Pyxidicoccus trucidator TaxID=2709662 RepID=UPI0013DB45B9|nr:hypothetical protein [Pyxidicoccus trucidator]